MTTDTTYNGYTNFETWCVSTWLSNDQGSQEFWTEVAADNMRRARMYPLAHFTVSEDARAGLAEALKDWAEENVPDLGASLWADLLGAALSDVDWHDIADSLLSDEDGYEAA